MQVRHAMSMPGGGCFAVGPGQYTDDSELALCLARGLATRMPPNLPLDSIATRYMEWLESHPFDVGMATMNAFKRDSKWTEIAASMTHRSAKKNYKTQANGALMRCTPLAVWAHKLDHNLIANYARQEAALSHPHQICQDAQAAYCIAIAVLINSPGDAKGAIKAAKTWCEANAHEDVRQWLKEATNDSEIPPVAGQGKDGWVRWGFTLAFRHLHLGSSYVMAIEDTLARGGDTDTNAAIVGGLLGAFHGSSHIPKEMRDAVLKRDVASGIERPDFLHPAQIGRLVSALYSMAENSPN